MTLHSRPVELPAKPDQEHALTTWWASATCQHSRPAFYDTAAKRLDTLRAKYGSSTVDTGWAERERRQGERWVSL